MYPNSLVVAYAIDLRLTALSCDLDLFLSRFSNYQEYLAFHPSHPVVQECISMSLSRFPRVIHTILLKVLQVYNVV